MGSLFLQNIADRTMGKTFLFLVTLLINSTYAINADHHELSSWKQILSKRQGLRQYGQLQPFPDPPFQPQYQGTPQTFQSQDNFLSQPLQPFTPGFSQPTFQTAVQPDVQPAFQPAIQPAFQPVAQPAVQPEIQPAIQPVVQPVVQPTLPPIATAPPVAQVTFQCDQQIMGRNLEYSSALQLIQNEDYLDESDIDEIRFFRRQGNFLEIKKQEKQSLLRVKRQQTN